jgi:formamidopyrimidine-DNA glycosylase
MPEGPELRHSRDVLRKHVQGKSIVRLNVSPTGRYKTNYPVGMQEAVNDLPLKVTDISVKGKFMWWTLQGQSSTWFMWITYGMSGQWSTLDKKHTSFVVEHDAGKLYFVDPRRFGTIKFVSSASELAKKLSSLGPDILAETPLTPELFAERILRKPNSFISALWLSKISPWRHPEDLRAEEIMELYTNVLSVAKNSYESGGATIHTYKSVDDDTGGFSSRFVVYGRKLDADGNPVIREEGPGGRTIHWAPNRQL